MTEKKNTEDLRHLTDLVNKWNYEYYILNKSSVDDDIYDRKLAELENLEKELNFKFEDSPTLRIGPNIKTTDLKLIKRRHLMLSIDNVDNYEGLYKFDNRICKFVNEKQISYVCELKIDGLSVSVTYKNGSIYQISTRGNGFVGEDVTRNINMISDLPKKITEKNIEIRGEVYISKSEFERVNEELKEHDLKKLSNLRNAAAGSLRSLNLKNDWINRNLNFFPYQVIPRELFNSQFECLNFLKSEFKISKYELCSNIAEIKEFIEKIEKQRFSFDFAIDGVVIKVNDYKYYDKLGETNKFPRWSIAYKFRSKGLLTFIKNINSEISKNGKASYVAELEPINLDGSLIRYVTLYNYHFIKNNLINLNDKVLIKKSGDVVPQIIEVLKENGTTNFWIPSEDCSSCYWKLTWDEKSMYQICRNNNCPERVINYLTFCASRSCLNIKGLSKKVISRMYHLEFLKYPNDFYSLKNKADKLGDLFGCKLIQNILISIEKSRYQTVDKVISSLNIPLLSTVKAREIIKTFRDIDILIKCFKAKDYLNISNILGKKTFASFENFFNDSQNLKILKDLRDCLIII
jgi:DNA ligase (NAD+)